MKKILTITLLSLLTFSTLAGNSDYELNIAQGLHNKNKAKYGYEFLLAEFDKNSKNPVEYRLLGLLAKADNQLFAAKDYFKQAIQYSNNPSLTGEMKLELAQVEYRLGNSEVAKQYLTQVKASNPPTKVGDNIDNFLRIINRRGAKRKYQFSASIGYMHDANANAGPSSDTVLLYGLPFTLSTDAKKTSSSAKILRFGVKHNTGIADNMRVQSSLFINKTNYSKVDNLDALSVALSSGVSYKLDEKTVVSVPIVLDWVKIGDDNSYYSYAYGVAPQVRYAINGQLSANGSLAVSRKKYQAANKGDSENLSLGGGLSYQIDNKSYVTGGLSLGKVNADNDASSSESNGINARYGYSFANGIRGSIGLNYNHSKYQGVEAAYTVPRKDEATTLSLHANYTVKQLDSDLIVSLSKTNNNSNLGLYDYKRRQVYVGLSHSF